jgi:hypothetical protein
MYLRACKVTDALIYHFVARSLGHAMAIIQFGGDLG